MVSLVFLPEIEVLLEAEFKLLILKKKIKIMEAFCKVLVVISKKMLEIILQMLVNQVKMIKIIWYQIIMLVQLEIDLLEEKQKMIMLVMQKQYHQEVKALILINTILAQVKLEQEQQLFHKEINILIGLSKIFKEHLRLEFQISIKKCHNKNNHNIKIKNLINFNKIYFK